MPSPETTADRQRFPFFTGGGEVGEATRAFEWSTSPIGPADQWPQSLKTLVSVMLGADQPMFVVWGPSRTLLYNQPYSQILATKHPAALGRDFLDVWSELRQDLIPIVHQAYDGEPVHMDDIELTMHRNGYPEETHFAFSYTPIRDEQEKVAGFFCACSEITQQVLAQRQQIAERERLNRMFQQAPGFRAMLEGPEHRFVLANPAYMQVVQHREVLGKTVAEALPEAVEQGYVTLLDRVFQSNEAFATAGARFEVSSAPGEPSCERFVDFVYQPVSDSEGRVTGIFVDGVDVTDRVINERRQAFRLALDERLRNLTGADAVLNAAVTMLGEHLGVNRVGYGQILPDGITGRLSHCFASGVAPLHGEYPLDSFGPEAIARQRRGEVEVCGDVEADPGQDPAVWSQIQTRAFVSVPLIREGRFVASLYVNSREPRSWSSEELALIKDVAGRTWDAIERAKAEAALRESEERYRGIVEGAENFAIVTLDQVGTITSWNTGAEHIVGFQSDEAIGRPSAIFFTPEDRAAGIPEEEMKRAREDGRALDERWHLRANGERFWGSGLTMPLGDHGYLKIFRDSTAEHESEAAVKEAQAAAETLAAERTATLGQLVEGVILTDAQGRITFVNESAQELHGTSQLHVPPERYAATYRLFTEDGRPYPSHELPLARAVAGETVKEARWRIRKADGSEILAIGSARPVVAADGTQIGAVLTLRDDTERSATEEALRVLNETLEHRVQERTKELLDAQETLRQSQKLEAIGQLTGGVAHDFNNLLTVIRGSADILKRQDLAEEKRSRYVEAIADTADRAAKLTSQLLAFARRQSLNPVDFDAVERLEGIREMLLTVVGSRVSLNVEADPDCCHIRADSSQFETAIMNLVVNARDAMKGEGRLTIRVLPAEGVPSVRGHGELQGEFVAVTVSDTGSGIPAQALNRIFDPFFTTKAVGQGTGLGLSQVFGFAKQSKGEVTVDSTEGVGTSFTLYLPRIRPSAPVGAVRSDDDQVTAKGQGRVLVVEDNVQVGEFASQLIEDFGYKTIWVSGGQEALDLLTSGTEPVDLVFSDVVMPGMSGVDLAEKVRERYPSLPIILTSGYSHVLAEEGSHGFTLIHKPYSADGLARALKEALSVR